MHDAPVSRAVDLRAQLASRSLPLAFVLAVITAISTPTAFYYVRVHELRSYAEGVASRVASSLEREARRRPTLFVYDSVKLLEHVRPDTQASATAAVVVVDPSGEVIAPRGFRPPDDALVWASTPVRVVGVEAARIWVAASLSEARTTALLLAFPFAGLGLVLAILAFGIPLGIVGRAERRILALVSRLDASRESLESMNVQLEAQVAARVAELARAYEDLSRKDKRLRSLSGKSMALAETERRAIARDLHDSVGQALTAIRIHGQLVAGTSDGTARAKHAQTVMELADVAIEEVRRAVSSLSPSILDELGLERAVVRHVEEVAAAAAIDASTEIDLAGRPLSAAVETAIFRLVQEGLTNVVRHADASLVQVSLVAREQELALSIVDDGCGLDEAKSDTGRGLRGMRERVELLGGRLTIARGAEKGTRIEVVFPAEARGDTWESEGGMDRSRGDVS